MEYFLQAFGDISIGRAAVVIGAIIFLTLCYKKVEKYFSERAIADKEKDDQIREVIEQAKQYPKWHQQSIDIQRKFTKTIDELKQGQKENTEKLEKMDAGIKKRERNKIREQLLQSYRYYTSTEKNPMLAWTEMESDAFWKSFEDYDEVGGNGHMHTTVKPAMRALEVIEMHDTERITELMKSRK